MTAKAPAPAVRAEPRDGPLPRARSAVVWLRYLATSPVRAVGAATGRHYAFSGGAAVQGVDARDADGMLASGHFARVDRS